MLLCRVQGNVVATHKHSSLNGWRLAVCQPINSDGAPEGSPQVAVDPLGACTGEKVLISSDGLATRRLVGDDTSPARWILICIVDEIESPAEESESSSAAGRASGGGAPRASK
jgi:microcompartment protein CcmK/EutM